MSEPAGGPREEFLSEEDLDLRNLTDEELAAWWNLWLRMAQATNELDEATYEHGVFDRDPAVPLRTTVVTRPPRTSDASPGTPG